jgi:hypothetical protein
MKKEKPKYLYKYRPINIHTINMILSNEAYFSLPKDFNDPFDCNVMPESLYTPEEHINFLNSIKEELTPEQFKNSMENPIKTFEYEWKGAFNNIRSRMRMFCLSEICNNVMMYSHYADSHQGICLEFLVSGDPFYDILEAVTYNEKIPVFHPFNADLNLQRKELPTIQLLTKSWTWSYEEEWRIIKDGPDPMLYKFPPDLLSSIIFGCRTSSDDKLLIKRLIENRVPSIQLKEAIKKDYSFDLEIKPHES